MARRVETVLIDDLDGSTADHNIRFGLDGTEYEIDLTEANAAELRGSLSRFIAASRKTRTPAGKGTRRTGRSATIRAWARDNGFKVSGRGAIQSSLVDAYEQAQSR
ncbi:Lsr2 family protein [Arthrobacter sp. 24S4-2]|uniref:histone-like nucleoid-structuring protein Lsr2 n=1 Tax=Arthrobacter sp. 24S4-2 TaxID=2575374 RepID=UPI0010C7BBD0|nr:Lsr2 family protein [Arthrobacter sp. 24S4-2]QCO96778.1 Lsr2 family protein [Arthrobacter sp. 24S4-2]